MPKNYVFFIIGIFLLFHSNVFATPLLNTNNNHYYEVVDVANSISWYDAKTAAEGATYMGLSGHLVTITSATEMNWILSNWDPSLYPTWDGSYPLFNRWIGAYQFADQVSPEVGWNWVTGEPWNYTYWYRTEPNDNAGATSGVEDNEENFAAFVALGQWFDYGPWNGPGYMIEYEAGNGNGGVVPEPATVLLLGGSVCGLGFWRKRKFWKTR